MDIVDDDWAKDSLPNDGWRIVFIFCSDLLSHKNRRRGRRPRREYEGLGFVLTTEGPDPNTNKWNELGLEDFLAQK